MYNVMIFINPLLKIQKGQIVMNINGVEGRWVELEVLENMILNIHRINEELLRVNDVFESKGRLEWFVRHDLLDFLRSLIINKCEMKDYVEPPIRPCRPSC